MKNTFLLNKTQEDGSVVLCTATAEEWLAVVHENRNLPLEQRRYFIADCIEEAGFIDRMFIEVTHSEYRRWNSRHTMSERNRKAKKQFHHLSLDAVLAETAGLKLKDCLVDSQNTENSVVDEILMDELKQALAVWKPWAPDLLEHYLAGRKRSCTAEMAEKYGVSEQVIRKYKRQVERFIKDFLGCVSL